MNRLTRVFDPSPTSPARRYYPQEENMVKIPDKVKGYAALTTIKVGAVAAIVAVVLADDRLSQATGRKWL